MMKGGMWIEVSACPVCGQEPQSIDETVMCNAEIVADEDGSFSYAGNSEMLWNTQEAPEDRDGRVTVRCAADHTHSVVLRECREESREQ